MFGFSYYLLLPLARGTNGNGYSSSAPLLPTPLASDTGDVGKGLDIQISANGSYRKMNKDGKAWTARLSHVLDKYPYQMSGGQQQRVAAARAMVTNPAIVLADEPTGALDSNSSRMLLTMLTELNERLSATILMVTHDAFSASYCNRILFIKDGQVFNELHRGTDTRKEFFTKILEVVSVLGGEQSEHM